MAEYKIEAFADLNELKTKVAMYEVLSPLGEVVTKAKSLAPRLDSLNDKTICEAWNGSFRGEKTFPIIRELLQKRYPEIKIIPNAELPTLNFVQIESSLEALPDTLLQKRCEALITGNGA